MGKYKNILIYYKGLRSFLLYSNLLESYPKLFDVVIEMPAIPFSRKTKKKNYKKIFRAFFQSPDFVLMQFLIINFFSFFNRIFKKSIYHICLKNDIEHKFFHKIDDKLIEYLENLDPNWIISSTSTLLNKEFLRIPRFGVINLHEAPLPSYRGSASYFWFLINEEKEVWVSVFYVVEELDAGDIIMSGPRIKIDPNWSVYILWKSLFKSYDEIWAKLIPYLKERRKIPAKKQNNENVRNYSYPSLEGMKKLRDKKIRTLNLKDFIDILKIAVTGKYNFE